MSAIYTEREAYHGSATALLSFPAPDLSVLSCFSLEYRAPANHVREVSVLPGHKLYPMSVYTCLADQDRKEPINYRVGYARLDEGSGIQVGTATGKGVGSSTTPLAIPEGFVFVIRGFSFFFNNKDHHFRRLRVEAKNGSLFLNFRDQKVDDEYNYTVKYALVPTSLFQQVAIRSIAPLSVYPAKGWSTPAPEGIKAIQGLRLTFDKGDSHIRGMGANSDRISVPSSATGSKFVGWLDNGKGSGIPPKIWGSYVDYAVFK